MEGIEFDEPQQGYSFSGQSTNEPRLSVLTRLMMKLGLAKDQAGANKVMLIISVCSLLLMTYFLISTYAPNLLNFSRPKVAPLTPEMQKQLDDMRNGTAPATTQ